MSFKSVLLIRNYTQAASGIILRPITSWVSVHWRMHTPNYRVLLYFIHSLCTQISQSLMKLVICFWWFVVDIRFYWRERETMAFLLISEQIVEYIQGEGTFGPLIVIKQCIIINGWLHTILQGLFQHGFSWRNVICSNWHWLCVSFIMTRCGVVCWVQKQKKSDSNINNNARKSATE